MLKFLQLHVDKEANDTIIAIYPIISIYSGKPKSVPYALYHKPCRIGKMLIQLCLAGSEQFFSIFFSAFETKMSASAQKAPLNNASLIQYNWCPQVHLLSLVEVNKSLKCISSL